MTRWREKKENHLENFLKKKVDDAQRSDHPVMQIKKQQMQQPSNQHIHIEHQFNSSGTKSQDTSNQNIFCNI